MSDWLLGLVTVLGTLVGADDADVECLRLGALDVVRSRALTTGDVAVLRGVYATDEGTAADAGLVRSYAARGLGLRGAGTERLGCRVVTSSRSEVVLAVVDRPGPTRVVDAYGRSRALPGAAATRRVVTLRATDDGWRVASVGAG